MNTDTHLQRFKTLLIKGLKISIIPTLLINALIAVLQSLFLNAVEPSWDFTFQDGVFLTLFGTVFFTIVALVGIVLISSVLTYRNRILSDVAAGFLGVIIGVVLAIIANFVFLIIFYSPDEYFRKYMFDFLLEGFFINALPNLATIFILVYVSRSLNKAEVITPITDDVFDDPVGAERIELRVAWLVTQVTGFGCIIFFVYQAIRNLVFGDSDWYPQLYDRIGIAVVWLGIKLLIALPVVLLGGFLSGVIVKRTRDKGLLSKRFSFLLGILMSFFVFTGISIALFMITEGNILEPYFLADFIVGMIIIVVAGTVIGKQLFSNSGRIIRLKAGKKWFRIVLKVAGVLLIAYSVVQGVVYFRSRIPSEREIWRNTEYYIFDPIVINNLFLFEGSKVRDQYVCDYIYAFDKITGEMVWSTETITKRYCIYVVNMGSLRHTIVGASETGDVIFIGLRDLNPLEDNQKYKLYAIRGTDGEMLWEVDGYAGDSLLAYSIAETGAIYSINEKGYFAAIDSRTGHQIWKQEVPQMDCWEDEIIIGYYDQIVYYSDPSNQLLIAFDAITGNPIWEISPQTNIAEIMASDKLIYLVTSSSDETEDDLYYVTALDIETGKDVWELSFEQAYPVTEIIGNEVFIVTSEWQGESENNRWLGVLDVVNKTTGELLWQFNGDSRKEGSDNRVVYYLVEGAIVYISAEGGTIFALENETGEIIWQTETSGFPFYFVVEDETLVAVYEDEYIVALDTKTGSQKWSVDIGIADTWDFQESMAVDNGLVFISRNHDQKIFALDLETGREVWSWQHNHPNDKRYYLKAVDENAIYVRQSLDTLFTRHWFFALKAEP